MIQLQNISKWFGDTLLYEDLSLYITENSRIGLIARNGTGKTTLLNIIAGRESADSGEVTFRRDTTIGYLCQDPIFDTSLSVIETLYHSNAKLIEVVEGYHAAIESQQSELLGELSIEMERMGAWDIEVRAKTILSKLNINNLHQKVETLSGGERRRLALAQVLVDNPDVLILDEPTNHLDLEMSSWLEEYLLKCGKTLFMVTHDRYFLDRVCTDIYEIDQKKLYSYKGGYSDYVERRVERIEQFESEKEKAQNIYRRELEWMRRMPQARGSKSKYRKDAFYDVKDKAFAFRNDSKVEINIGHERLGTKIFEAKSLSKKFDDKCVLDKFSYLFARGEKLGIIGKNGTGKSTLLRILIGDMLPDSGEVDLGSSVKFGYYRQEGMEFDENAKVIDIARSIAEVVVMGDGSNVGVSQFLNQFLFEPAVQHSFVAKLSGGERRRLYLLTVLMQSPNFLILDEPTNDLDIATLNVLEAYLENFSGCVIVVSHDRYFMDKVTDHLLVFEGDGKTKLFEGNYTQYRNSELEKTESQTTRTIKQPQTESQDRGANRAKKLSYKEQVELVSTEQEIARLEVEKESLEQSMSSGKLSSEDIVKISVRYGEVNELIEEKTLRWMELEDIKG